MSSHPDDSDPELDDILNDALNDFNTVCSPNIRQQKSFSEQIDNDVTIEEEPKETDQFDNESYEDLRKKMEEMLSIDPNMNDTSLDKFMENLSDEEKKTFATLSKAMESIFSASTNEVDAPLQEEQNTTSKDSQNSNQQKELDDIITETLSMLNQVPESWKEESIHQKSHSEEKKDVDPDALLNDMLKLIGQAGNTEEKTASDALPEDDDKMIGILENMMQSFLSPDILLEPMEKLVEQYPIWLKEKKGVVETELYIKVENQYKYAKQICEVYHSKQFPACMEEVMMLMSSMQENGQPPEEIVEAITKDGGEMPQLPSMPSGSDLPGQCPVQ